MTIVDEGELSSNNKIFSSNNKNLQKHKPKIELDRYRVRSLGYHYNVSVGHKVAIKHATIYVQIPLAYMLLAAPTLHGKGDMINFQRISQHHISYHFSSSQSLVKI